MEFKQVSIKLQNIEFEAHGDGNSSTESAVLIKQSAIHIVEKT